MTCPTRARHWIVGLIVSTVWLPCLVTDAAVPFLVEEFSRWHL
ncbi:MAG: hypothetical protein R3C28_03460 [Pirellulaceae bacterium]